MFGGPGSRRPRSVQRRQVIYEAPPGRVGRVSIMMEASVAKHSASSGSGKAKTAIKANAQNRYEVTRADLPLHCPMDSMSLWNSHPRVFLPIEKTGTAKCPYCGADYVLTE